MGVPTSVNIKQNLNNILVKISEAEKKAGRLSGSVKLMAVSKFHSIDEINQTIEAHHLLYGENRVQESIEKFSVIKESHPEVKMHIIGQLQTNKVKNAVKIADCIQSVDRLDLIKEIEKQCAKINKNMDILFEIHTGEESKSGFESENELCVAMDEIASGNYPHVIPKGFMTMAPFTEDKVLIRKSFITLRELSEKMKNKYPQFDLQELSMGMSGDFEIAIEEGATLVRVGTAIFGERDYSK